MIYVALLRGINVSGKNLLKMEALQRMFIDLGYTNVQTYIQSGNVVFQSPEKPNMELESQIQTAIKSSFGYDVPIIVLSATDLQHIHESNPFIGDLNADSRKICITILSATPDPKAIASIKYPDYGTDSFVIGDRAVYIYCPDSLARTKLTNDFWERKLKLQATSRNLNTIRYLSDLLSAMTNQS